MSYLGTHRSSQGVTRYTGDPYKVASDYFREQEILNRDPGLYYFHEILALKARTLEDLRQIHEAKLAFPGCRVIQEGAEGKEQEEKGVS